MRRIPVIYKEAAGWTTQATLPVKPTYVTKGGGFKVSKLSPKLRWGMLPAFVGLSIAGEEIQRRIHKSLLGRKHKKAFTEMQKIFPEFAEMDPNEVKNYFDVIVQYAPHFATHPATAGSLVKQMVSMKGTVPERLFSLIKAEREMRPERMPGEIVSGALLSVIPRIE